MKDFVIDQAIDVISFCEPFELAFLVLEHPAVDAVRDARVEIQ